MVIKKIKRFVKFTSEERKKINRIEVSRKRLNESERKLNIQRFRRQQAEKGNVIKALFGKPKSTGLGKSGRGKVLKRKLGEMLDGTVIMNESEKKSFNDITNSKTGRIICAKNTKRLKARLAGITPRKNIPISKINLGPRGEFSLKDQKALDDITKPFNQRNFKEPDTQKKRKI